MLSAQTNDNNDEEEATINTLMHETFNVDELDMTISEPSMQQANPDTEPVASQIPDSQPIDSARMEDSLKISDALSSKVSLWAWLLAQSVPLASLYKRKRLILYPRLLKSQFDFFTFLPSGGDPVSRVS